MAGGTLNALGVFRRNSSINLVSPRSISAQEILVTGRAVASGRAGWHFIRILCIPVTEVFSINGVVGRAFPEGKVRHFNDRLFFHHRSFCRNSSWFGLPTTCY